MELVLEVISYKGLPSPGGISARFNEQGGSIGRSVENRLSLPDAEKFISRHHANIRIEGGRFVLQDVSTGGTWLCNEDRWLTQASVPLADGDLIKIGEYELRARIEAAVQGEFAGFLGDLPEHRPAPLDASPGAEPLDLFSDNNPLPPPLGPLPSLVDPNAFPSLIGQPEASPYEESYTPPGIQQTPVPPSLEVDFSIDNFFQDGYESPLSAQHAPAPAEDGFPDLDELLGDGLGLQEQPIAPPPLPVTEQEQPIAPPPLPVAEQDQPIVPPTLPSEEEVWPVLPDVSDIFAQPLPVGPSEDLKTAAMPKQDGDATEHVRPSLAAPVAEPPIALSLRDIPQAPPPGPAALDLPGTPPENPAPAINIPKPGRPSPQPAAPFAEPAPVSPLPPRQPPAQPAPPQPVAGEAEDLFRCFLEGAGLSELSNLTPEQQRKAMKTVGMAYREMVDGLMQVLLARKMEKSMIALRRTDVTMVQPRENNPLKVFPTVEETMKEMVCQNNPAYIGPSEAVREGFSDIMKHQMAMRAGMQAALDGFLRRLEPASIEERFKEGIVFQKKAKCWDAYCQAYPKLAKETMDELFGEAFAEAYREQLRILRGPQH